jgi:Tfp pilus assembly protein PilV
MGFLDFLGSGGSGLITGLANTITGAVQNKKALAWQKEQWQQSMDYGREMWEKQNQAENERMALQNQWNKDAAAQSQQYAKEMFDYTGYENQVKQMKAAGLNPALMNGGGGSAGQASAGAEVQPAQAFQPMGIQMALQAQQVMANTQLANAQAESANKPVEFTISKELWEASKKENTVTLYYNVNNETISITINAINSYIEKETESDGIVKVTCRNKAKLVFPNKELSVGVYTATGKAWNSSQGVWIPSYTSSYKQKRK